MLEEEVPWLQKSVYLKILQSEEQLKNEASSISLLSCSVLSGLDNGCNYMGENVRIEVQFNSTDSDDIISRFFMIKTPLMDGNSNELIFVKNEIMMYNEILPKVYQIAQLQIAPKIYDCPWPNCLLMEDLSVEGYMMNDSLLKLDYKHAKATLITLAKFHAATVAIKYKYPEEIKRNGVETVYTHDPNYAERFKPQILIKLYGLARVLQTMRGLERYGDTLIDTGEEFWDLIVEVFKPNGKINVLNHGNFWTNNILFKYNSEGVVSDVKLIDFQLRRYCSPSIDLLYFFWTSADDIVRRRMYELIETYRHTLNNSLAELGCSDRLTRQHLKEDISKACPLILLLCLHLPDIFPDPNCLLDISKIQPTEDCFSSYDFDINPLLFPFKGKFFRTALPEFCKELDTMKIFQILKKNKKP